ncbi:MAG: DNA primase large subunit PriL [archaeon GB-1867-097]|nr:DNA primase large subunit PriL [Candidatus Culexmicrobium thermophilum]MCS7384632.1 DNA primase large subunit PriL [Candidatus Culexmicrobium thermophilum]
MSVELTREDLAKYPFCREAAKYVKDVGLDLQDLFKPGYRVILERAVKRVRAAIELGKINTDLSDVDVELLSYPASLFILSIIAEPPLYRRYAVAEAKRIYEELKLEDDLKVKYLAESNFKWNVKIMGLGLFELHFQDYLKIAPSFRALNWKLVNRDLSSGWVKVSRGELSRLISEMVKLSIVGKSESTVSNLELPESFRKTVDELRRLYEGYRRVFSFEEEYKGPVVEEAFPPCIRRILSSLLKGESLPHMARFALTSFLVNVGKSVDDIVSLFNLTADFSENITRYQVEHIAGFRGSRKKYTPPSCSTLRTFGLCFPEDDLCRRVKHPLMYYKLKVKGRGRKSGR